MKRAILNLMNNPDERKRIGAEAKKTIIERHLWRHNAERILDIYKRVG